MLGLRSRGSPEQGTASEAVPVFAAGAWGEHKTCPPFQITCIRFYFSRKLPKVVVFLSKSFSPSPCHPNAGVTRIRHGSVGIRETANWGEANRAGAQTHISRGVKGLELRISRFRIRGEEKKAEEERGGAGDGIHPSGDALPALRGSRRPRRGAQAGERLDLFSETLRAY